MSGAEISGAPEAMLEVKNLVKVFPVRAGFFGGGNTCIKAVDNISFSILKGETFGLVGESGCGKTTVGRTVLRLHEPDGGRILFDGADITKVNMKPVRKRMQMIFQDPYSSLNPRMTVGDMLDEPMTIHGLAGRSERKERILQLLEMTGLNKDYVNRYPHEFSGGQRQRISIARALAVQPEFIVCDEPISALDISIQAQIVNLLEDLQEKFGLTYLFVAHDLTMIRHISNKVGVMYLGKLVEAAGCEELYERPRHPYTQALLSAVPSVDLEMNMRKSRIIPEGDNPVSPPSGCRFRTRCRIAVKKCKAEEPEFREISSGHMCACHLI